MFLLIVLQNLISFLSVVVMNSSYKKESKRGFIPYFNFRLCLMHFFVPETEIERILDKYIRYQVLFV